MQIETIVPPPVEPVTLAEAQAQLNVLVSGSPATNPDDAKITRLIRDAREWVEQCLGEQLVHRTMRLTVPGLPYGHRWVGRFGPTTMDLEFGVGFPNRIKLPGGPIQSISSITYYDTANALQTLSASTYRLIKDKPDYVEQVEGTDWPSTAVRSDAVRIDYIAGYPTGGGSPATGYRDNIPETARNAVLEHVQIHYDALGPADSKARIELLRELIAPMRRHRFT